MSSTAQVPLPLPSLPAVCGGVISLKSSLSKALAVSVCSQTHFTGSGTTVADPRPSRPGLPPLGVDAPIPNAPQTMNFLCDDGLQPPQWSMRIDTEAARRCIECARIHKCRTAVPVPTGPSVACLTNCVVPRLGRKKSLIERHAHLQISRPPRGEAPLTSATELPSAAPAVQRPPRKDQTHRDWRGWSSQGVGFGNSPSS